MSSLILKHLPLFKTTSDSLIASITLVTIHLDTSIFITSSDNAYIVGYNLFSLQNVGFLEESPKKLDCLSQKQISQLILYRDKGAAVTKAGELLVFGTINTWYFGNSLSMVLRNPTKLFDNVKDVVLSRLSACILLQNGNVQCHLLRSSSELKDIVQIVATSDCFYGLDLHGDVWEWGKQYIHPGGAIITKLPTKVKGLHSRHIVSISSHPNAYHAVALDKYGSVFVWGKLLGEQIEIARNVGGATMIERILDIYVQPDTVLMQTRDSVFMLGDFKRYNYIKPTKLEFKSIKEIIIHGTLISETWKFGCLESIGTFGKQLIMSCTNSLWVDIQFKYAYSIRDDS